MSCRSCVKSSLASSTPLCLVSQSSRQVAGCSCSACALEMACSCARYDRRKRVWVYCTPLRSANRTAAISKNTPHTSSSFCQRKRKSQSCTRFTPCHLLLFRFARSAASRGLWRSGRHPAPVYYVWFFAGQHRLCGLLHCVGEAATAPHAGATVR